jgi:hypothetical protein
MAWNNVLRELFNQLDDLTENFWLNLAHLIWPGLIVGDLN